MQVVWKNVQHWEKNGFDVYGEQLDSGQFPLHWLHNHPAIHIIQNMWLDSL